MLFTFYFMYFNWKTIGFQLFYLKNRPREKIAIEKRADNLPTMKWKKFWKKKFFYDLINTLFIITCGLITCRNVFSSNLCIFLADLETLDRSNDHVQIFNFLLFIILFNHVFIKWQFRYFFNFFIQFLFFSYVIYNQYFYSFFFFMYSRPSVKETFYILLFFVFQFFFFFAIFDFYCYFGLFDQLNIIFLKLNSIKQFLDF